MREKTVATEVRRAVLAMAWVAGLLAGMTEGLEELSSEPKA